MNYYEVLYRGDIEHLKAARERLPKVFFDYANVIERLGIIIRYYDELISPESDFAAGAKGSLEQGAAKYGVMVFDDAIDKKNSLILINISAGQSFENIIDSLFHETIHAVRRIDLGQKFPDEQKSVGGILEEIIARSGANYLAKLLGISPSEVHRKNDYVINSFRPMTEAINALGMPVLSLNRYIASIEDGVNVAKRLYHLMK